MTRPRLPAEPDQPLADELPSLWVAAASGASLTEGPSGVSQHGLDDRVGPATALSGALGAIGLRDQSIVPLNLVADFGGGAMYLAFGVVAGGSEQTAADDGLDPLTELALAGASVRRRVNSRREKSNTLFSDSKARVTASSLPPPGAVFMNRRL